MEDPWKTSIMLGVIVICIFIWGFPTVIILLGSLIPGIFYIFGVVHEELEDELSKYLPPRTLKIISIIISGISLIIIPILVLGGIIGAGWLCIATAILLLPLLAGALGWLSRLVF